MKLWKLTVVLYVFMIVLWLSVSPFTLLRLFRLSVLPVVMIVVLSVLPYLLRMYHCFMIIAMLVSIIVIVFNMNIDGISIRPISVLTLWISEVFDSNIILFLRGGMSLTSTERASTWCSLPKWAQAAQLSFSGKGPIKFSPVSPKRTLKGPRAAKYDVQ